MKIIKSTLADVGAIMQRYDEATDYQKIVGKKVWQGFDPAIVEEAILEGRQWKIMENGQIACVFTLTFEDALIWKERNADPSIYIHRIATNPAFRGRHFVKNIVAWAKIYALEHGQSFIRMDTSAGNEKLNNYYIGCGFDYLGITEMGEAEGLPAHYRNGSFSLFEIALNNKIRIKTAKNADDVAKCQRVLLELRPHIAPEKLVPMVLDMFGEGYRLAFVEENGEAVSAIGFRYLQFLFCGKHIYVDDLVTLPEFRGAGHAGALLDFVDDHAQAHGLNFVTLDSGSHRHTAHRLYLNKGFDITAHHFTKKI